MDKLQNIAADMKGRLANVEKGWVQRALFGGLVIVLERRGRTWRLALGRTKAPPSTTETAVCQEAFRCPPDVEWSWSTRRNQKQKLTYQIAETTWLEIDGEVTLGP